MHRGILRTLGLLFLFAALSYESSYASHMMGVDLTYECLNNCTIRVHLRAYRDCTGASGITNTINFVPSTAGCTAPTPLSGWSPQQTVEVTPVCPGWPTRCNSAQASVNGVEEYYWYRDYDICAAGNCTFTLTWSGCCRNGAITSGASNQSMYIGTTTLNTALTNCNSSPQFTTPPVPYICAGQPYTFNQGAFDPDGDSLSYALGPCSTSATSAVTYSGGYSPTQPLGSSWNVSINSVTGDITVAPQPGSAVVAVLCVQVTEWRNGVAINTIVRDIQMTVLPCPNNNLPTTVGITNLNGGVVNSAFQATVCLGTNITFQIPLADANVGDIITAFWNQNIPGATFSNAANATQQDTITGTNPTAAFSWTPTTLGQYTFLITIQDNACPIIGQNQYTIQLNVIGGLLGANAAWAPTGCTDVAFTANPGTAGTGPYSYAWTGTGNLNINANNASQNLAHTYPGPGTYYSTVTITDSYGCTEVIDDTVTITTGPTANAGPDVSICSGYQTQLGAAPIAGQTYAWTPGTGLSSTTSSAPNFQHSVVTLPDTILFSQTANDGSCTSVDYATVVVYPIPTASISGNTNICDGDSTTLTVTAGSGYLWSTGDTSQSIRVSPNTTTTYSCTVIDNGCASQPATITVNVSQGPIAIVSGPTAVCPGDNANLTVVGGTSWNWSTGSTQQTITLNNLQTATTVTVVPSIGTCSGQPVSYTVNVNAPPVAGFTNPNPNCDDANVQFTDGAFDNNGNIIGWSWNFGDPSSNPNTSSNQNPSHTFSAPGVYAVTQIVTSSTGCRDTSVQNVFIRPLPDPDFTFQDVCDGLDMSFAGSVQGGGPGGQITSWDWDFGDGTTASGQNTTHLFGNPGPHNVILTVTDQLGCVNTVEKTVLVFPNPTANFTWNHSCFNTVTQFNDASTLNDPYGTYIAAWNWDFGHPASGVDNSSNLPNPVHNFVPGNNYQVTLTVTTTRGCTHTITRNVSVAAINPLVAVYDSVCFGFPARPAVTNIPPNVTVEWYYNPTATNYFHTGNQYNTPPLAQNTIYYVGMLDASGCRSPRVPVLAHVYPKPNGGIEVNQNELEIPNAIANFNYVQANPNATVVAYAWDFGDGSGGSAQNVVHQYTTAGTYDVSLTVITDDGCEYTFTRENWVNVEQRIRLYVPNAFSPNADGDNDFFFVQSRLVTDFSITILDRWGRVIYESNDLSFQWGGTGKDGQLLPEGVYVYTIKATGYDGSKLSKSGSITLIK